MSDHSQPPPAVLRAACRLLVEGVATKPAHVRTRLCPDGQALPVLCTRITANGHILHAEMDYPANCQAQAERAAKAIRTGTVLMVEYDSTHARVFAHHTVITLQDPQAPHPEPSAQKEIF